MYIKKYHVYPLKRYHALSYHMVHVSKIVGLSHIPAFPVHLTELSSQDTELYIQNQTRISRASGSIDADINRRGKMQTTSLSAFWSLDYFAYIVIHSLHQLIFEHTDKCR